MFEENYNVYKKDNGQHWTVYGDVHRPMTGRRRWVAMWWLFVGQGRDSPKVSFLFSWMWKSVRLKDSLRFHFPPWAQILVIAAIGNHQEANETKTSGGLPCRAPSRPPGAGPSFLFICPNVFIKFAEIKSIHWVEILAPSTLTSFLQTTPLLLGHWSNWGLFRIDYRKGDEGKWNLGLEWQLMFNWAFASTFNATRDKEIYLLPSLLTSGRSLKGRSLRASPKYSR